MTRRSSRASTAGGSAPGGTPGKRASKMPTGGRPRDRSTASHIGGYLRGDRDAPITGRPTDATGPSVGGPHGDRVGFRHGEETHSRPRRVGRIEAARSGVSKVLGGPAVARPSDARRRRSGRQLGARPAVGRRIRTEVLGRRRAEYSERIVRAAAEEELSSWNSAWDSRSWPAKSGSRSTIRITTSTSSSTTGSSAD
jgi:hypothetical protein